MSGFFFTLLRLYKLADFIADHREQIERAMPFLIPIGAWVSGLAAWYANLSIATIIIFSVLGGVVVLVGMVYIPRLLNEWLPRPFAVYAPGCRGLHDAAHSVLYVDVEVFSRTKNNLSLRYALHLRPEKGRERRYLQTDLLGAKEELGPDDHAKGILIFNVGSLTDDPSWVMKEAHLSVTDIRSRRAVRIPIATQQSQYPPGQFDYD